ncbi:Nuclear control of ATPase protein 2 [Aspergillus nanangensis]|uniref:Nuclear control of ATPase protein 2 n=1 Tax=Aspergillus nanangensis TaxID=2582783 RepID=A0AAD4CTH3_ASPNN|nr:Nuclear control of ATPase protein 2 [Aspergillus nanangensis]
MLLRNLSAKMSVIKSKIHSLDLQLDRLERQKCDSHLDTLRLIENDEEDDSIFEYISRLEDIISALSVTSKSQPLLHSKHIADLISKASFQLPIEQRNCSNVAAIHAMDLLWLMTGKATVQTLGVLLKTLLDQTISLNDEIYYWEDVFASHWHSGFYALQTSPFRLWSTLVEGDLGGMNRYRQATYQRVPFRISALGGPRSQVNQNRCALKALKDFNASAIGALMADCFRLNLDASLPKRANYDPENGDNWRGTTSRAVIIMETLLQTSLHGDDTPGCAEDIFGIVDRELDESKSKDDEDYFEPPTRVIERLTHILEDLLPRYTAQSILKLKRFGRPPRLVRYWLPISATALCGSTLLKILISRRFELLSWVTHIGSTCIEFWSNWVMEPVQKLIGTIRHDDTSEIALMSKNSLEADRASLERMVVDFVLDRDDSTHTDRAMDTNIITSKVREGDLTPVLRAYEKDLRTPFIGTVRGDLVRALLIQVQKTKVDVEIAIGGIDALLKSQELVFGFVGLTPGIMVSYACFRWVWGLLGNRRGLRTGRKHEEFRRALRDVHRTLLLPPTTAGLLAYKNHGLLICETETLLQKAHMILSGADLRAFQEDIGDLIQGNEVYRQLSIVDRLGWSYSRQMR